MMKAKPLIFIFFSQIFCTYSIANDACEMVLFAMRNSGVDTRQSKEIFQILKKGSPRMARAMEKLVLQKTDDELRAVDQLLWRRAPLNVGDRVQFASKHNGLDLKGSFILHADGTLEFKITHITPSFWDKTKRLNFEGFLYGTKKAAAFKPAVAKKLGLVTKMISTQSAASGAEKPLGLKNDFRPFLEEIYFNLMAQTSLNYENIKRVRIVGDTIVNQRLANMLLASGFETTKTKYENFTENGYLLLFGSFIKGAKALNNKSTATHVDSKDAAIGKLKALHANQMSNDNKVEAKNLEMVIELTD